MESVSAGFGNQVGYILDSLQLIAGLTQPFTQIYSSIIWMVDWNWSAVDVTKPIIFLLWDKSANPFAHNNVIIIPPII